MPGVAKKEAGEYEDVPGFCQSATLEEIEKHGFVLTPGRYVGIEEQEDDGEPFEEKMERLTRLATRGDGQGRRAGSKPSWQSSRSLAMGSDWIRCAL